MFITEKSLALEETIQQLGYDSVEDFALLKAKENLLQQIAESSHHIDFFENKYGIDYSNFCKDFHQLPQPAFEKEEDSADWNAELKLLLILNKRLSRLS